MAGQQNPQAMPVDQVQVLHYVQQLEVRIRDMDACLLAILAPPPLHVETPKPITPPLFRGKMGKSIDTWIFRVKQYNLTMKMVDDILILFTTSFLSKHAANWWHRMFLEM